MPGSSTLSLRFRAAAILSWFVLTTGGCEPPELGEANAAKAGAKETLRVATTQVERARLERHYQSSGTLQAVREAQIVATQLGVIRALTVHEGDRVEMGQILARLDARELSLQAAVDELALGNLERELERLQSAGHGVIPREEIDKQRYAVEEARASARLSDVHAKQTIVRAPFAGTIVERYVDEGNLATTATPLFRIADTSTLLLELHLPERDAATVSDDAKAEITLVDDTTFVARVLRRAPVVDPVTGTVKFTLATDVLPRHAVPGAYARAKVLIDARAEAPSLPKTAVFEVEGRSWVYLIADGRAQRREVHVGLRSGERVEVLDGVGPEDVIIVEGNAGITEGMPLQAAKVEPVPAIPQDS